MARTNSRSLNLLGVVSLLIGVAAFVATKMPIAGYGPVQIAYLGIGVGVLAFLLSLVIRWGSGTAVLGILLSVGALALVGYNNGTLQDWWARVHPAPAAPAPAVVAPATPGPTVQEDTHVHSIFETDKPGSTPTPSHVSSPAPAITSTPAPTISTPTPAPIPAIPQPPMPTVSQARAKLDAARTAVEESLSTDPAYVQAKAEVATADAARKTAVTDSGPGSPQVLESSTQWLAAQGKLKKLVDAAMVKDSAAQTAQREMSEAEANIRGGKSGEGK